MPRVITNLCLRHISCVEVCPVDCIKPGVPEDMFPTFYINPDECIDCGACEIECPHGAIFEKDLVPDTYIAKGGERLNKPVGTEGFTETYDCKNQKGEDIHLKATRMLEVGEKADLTNAIAENVKFFSNSSN